MLATRADIIKMAHRRIGVLSTDEEPTADMDAFAGQVLDGLFDELTLYQGVNFASTLDRVPGQAFLPLSNLLGVEIAPHYGVGSPDTRSRCIMILRALSFPNDIPDDRDFDDDGRIEDCERDAGQRSLYY